MTPPDSHEPYIPEAEPVGVPAKMHPLDPARIGPEGLYNRLINTFTGASSEGIESVAAIGELRSALAEASAQQPDRNVPDADDYPPTS